MPLRRFLIVFILLLSACGGGIAIPPTWNSPTPQGDLPTASPSTPESGANPEGTTPNPPNNPQRGEGGASTQRASPTPTQEQTAPTPEATQPPITKLLFTGIIVPARCVQAAIDERGDANYLYEEVRHLISEADLAIGTLNAALSDYPPRTGCVPTYVLVGGPENADALARAGFDLMSVATNHIKNCGLTNCGNRTFFDTLDNLRRVGIQPVGAGENLSAAMQPVVVEVNGLRFGFVSLGEIEASTFATESEPGIAVLTEGNLRRAIARVREVADVVIALPHWGPEYSPHPNHSSQRPLAQAAVDAGADLVVGNHTHVVQAIQVIDGVPVFYGLGNFIFDQTWSPETQQGVILEVTFEGKVYAGHELIPVHYNADGRVRLASPEQAEEILDRIQKASERLP